MFSGVEGSNLHSMLKEQGAVDLAEGIEEQFIALETIFTADTLTFEPAYL